jgi:hypothetical protein
MAKRPPLGGSAPPANLAASAAPREAAPVRTTTPARQGKLQFAGYLDATLKRELDVFAAREGRSLQSIFEEMHDLFAERYGLHRITGTR